MEYNAARTRRFVSQNLSYIIIFSAVVVFVRIYTSRTLISLSTVPEEIVEVDPHPIPQLIADAQERFGRKVARQSRTLEAAAAEYRRRYGRNPPKGFDKWWAFAKDNDFVMVDEFDGLVDDLEPLPSIDCCRCATASISGVILGEQLARRALQMIRPTWPPPPNTSHSTSQTPPQTPPAKSTPAHATSSPRPPSTTSIPARPQLSSI
ncbi:hypothetical protein BD626DRAFT_524559 [Schizophyllum amplum]|uniref:Uncharacterized protein n=1 Tax=Schizophyllum amplum TaxID=97359 RepID=A0A550BSP1_9AGAR|nr:hypothetical protein BD626DRAFT_524528 [Auriculariopsis ampla]TRM55572.1 hypothetical protein BD626DRAFT_524559 [Auriculariopsis ampla]